MNHSSTREDHSPFSEFWHFWVPMATTVTTVMVLLEARVWKKRGKKNRISTLFLSIKSSISCSLSQQWNFFPGVLCVLQYSHLSILMYYCCDQGMSEGKREKFITSLLALIILIFSCLPTTMYFLEFSKIYVFCPSFLIVFLLAGRNVHSPFYLKHKLSNNKLITL